MGKIKKILENELVGGTQSTDIYPVTSTKAIYDENNVRLDDILKPATKESEGLMSPEDKNNIELVQTELAGKVDKASVVQESGDSEELIMSQKAISDKLSNLSSTITEIKEKATTAANDASNALKKAEAANKTAEDNKSTLNNTIIPDISTLKEKVEDNKSALTTATSDISELKKKVDDIPANIPKFVSMTEAAYEALETKEADTYYMLTEE